MPTTGTLPSAVAIDTAEVITTQDLAGPNSTFGTSTLFSADTDVTIGPIAYADSGGYLKTTPDELELGVEFYTDAPEIQIKIERSNSDINFFVDDISQRVVEINLGYSQRLYTFEFPDSRIRKVRIQGTRYGFGGVYVEGSGDYTVWPVTNREERPLLAVITDSFGNAIEGTYGNSFTEYLAEEIDVDLYTDAMNSTGWSSTGANLTTTRATNMTTLDRKPKFILGCMGFNDKYASETDIKNGINNWVTTLRAEFPAARYMVTGPWFPNGTDVLLSGVSTWISEQAALDDIGFVDLFDVFNSSNNDRYISVDGTHPNDAGYQYLAKRLAEKLKDENYFFVRDIGWADYEDSTYTSGSPFAVTADTDIALPNDGLGGNKNYEPDGVSLYDTASGTITGINGETRLITIDFKVTPTNVATTTFEVWFDIGGGIPPLYRRIVGFPKGNGIERNITLTTLVYTLDTWEANGATVYIRANGTADVYDIRYVISNATNS